MHEKLPADKLNAHNGGWSSGLDKLVAYAVSNLSSGASA